MLLVALLTCGHCLRMWPFPTPKAGKSGGVPNGARKSLAVEADAIAGLEACATALHGLEGGTIPESPKRDPEVAEAVLSLVLNLLRLRARFSAL